MMKPGEFEDYLELALEEERRSAPEDALQALLG